MTLSIFDITPWDTQSIPAPKSTETATRQLVPSPRRPDAAPETVSTEQTSFALVPGSTGEIPITDLEPATISQAFAPATYGGPAEQSRPPHHRPQHRAASPCFRVDLPSLLWLAADALAWMGVGFLAAVVIGALG